MPKQVTVDFLVFGAHADDIELSCGATVAKTRPSRQARWSRRSDSRREGTRGTTRFVFPNRLGSKTSRRRLSRAPKPGRTAGSERTGGGAADRRTDPSAPARLVIAPYPDDRHPITREPGGS